MGNDSVLHKPQAIRFSFSRECNPANTPETSVERLLYDKSRSLRDGKCAKAPGGRNFKLFFLMTSFVIFTGSGGILNHPLSLQSTSNAVSLFPTNMVQFVTGKDLPANT